MESLKVKSVIALLNDTDFDIESLNKLQITIDSLIKTKYQTNLRNHYLEKLEEYYNDGKKDENMLKSMIENINFIKISKCLSFAEHNKIQYSAMYNNTEMRIYKTDTRDCWWLNKNNEIHGFNSRNEKIGPPPKEVLQLAIFLLKYEKIL
jgi:hypothetical protein